MQHNESSTLHTLAPSGELFKGLVKAVKVALNEKCEFFHRKIGALLHALSTQGHAGHLGRHAATDACPPTASDRHTTFLSSSTAS